MGVAKTDGAWLMRRSCAAARVCSASGRDRVVGRAARMAGSKEAAIDVATRAAGLNVLLQVLHCLRQLAHAVNLISSGSAESKHFHTEWSCVALRRRPPTGRGQPQVTSHTLTPSHFIHTLTDSHCSTTQFSSSLERLCERPVSLAAQPTLNGPIPPTSCGAG